MTPLRTTPARMLVVSAAVLALLGVPVAALYAQARYAVSGFAAVNRSLGGEPALIGLGVSTFGLPFGARVSGGFGTRAVATTPDGGTAVSPTPTPWMLDADVLLSTAAIPELRALLGGFDAAVFSGVGAQGWRGVDSGGSTLVGSYGGMLSRTLAGSLSLDAEARYRTPISLQGAAASSEFSRAWEYRLGVSLFFGGRRATRGRIPVALPSGRTPSAPASASATRVLNTADDYLGTRYVYGGTSPESGFDCSGFVQYVFRKNDVTLPRTSRQQAQVGQGLAARVTALRPGDLMMFASNGSRIDHVAIYAGNSRIIHSSSSGGGVRFDDLTTSRGRWFVEHFTTARRVLANGQSLVTQLEAALRAADALDPPDRAPKP